ncbi:hypothetical protein G9A89_000123 [Geosiphon pyriformis]|nr:hypothetical protein G9A89_000123 [Geosiphon pyriformis]
MEPASLVADGFGSTSVDMRTQPDAKKKELIKPRNPKVNVGVVDLSAGSLGLTDIGNANDKFSRSWDSEMESEVSSISSLSDLENLKNTVTKEISYADSNASVVNNMKDNTTFKKTHTCTYMLDKPPKTPSFDVLSDDDNMVALPSPKFAGSKKLHSIGSRASEKHIFNPVKSFALDIRTSALSGKTIDDKLIAFSGIIRSSFTFKLSLIKAKELAVSEKILVNIDVKKPNIHSDWEVIVKKIPVDLLRLVIESVFSKFGHVISIRMQLIGLWQKALVKFESSNSVLMDHHWTLLYTIPIGTTAHDLSDLVNFYGGKTCFIGCNPSSYMYNRCVIVCFANKAFKLAVIGSIPVYKGVNLHWAGLSLAYCAKCECFGHISNMCLVGENSGVHHRQVVSSQDQICLANIYKRKQAPVVCLVSFGGKTWVQVASDLSSHVFSSVPSGAGSTLSAKPLVVASDSLDNSGLTDCMASLKHVMEILLDQVSEILRKLSFVKLVPIFSSSCIILSVVDSLMGSALISDMAVDSVVVPSPSPLFSLVVGNTISKLSLSSSKVLTTKVDSLESKIMALKVSVGLVLTRLNSLCSGLDLSAPFPSQ